MEEKIKKMLAKTAIIYRSYNNKYIVDAVKAADRFPFAAIFVAVNESEDHGGTIGQGGWLDQYLDDPRFFFQGIKNYTWSVALNECLNTIGLLSNSGHDIQYVLNCSVETKWREKDLVDMLKAIQDPNIGAVGASFMLSVHREIEELFGKPKIHSSEFGPSYQKGRNTFMLFKRSALSENLGFRTQCDSWGGMEDYDFLLRMTAGTRYKFKYLDIKVPLHWGVRNFHAKIKLEQEAMLKIIFDLRRRFKRGSVQRLQIDNAIREMGLSEWAKKNRIELMME